MAAAVEHVGVDEATARQLWLVRLGALDELGAADLPAGHHIAVVAAATHALGEAAIHRFAAALLDAGAVYVCCWGPGCERLHDLIDDAVLFRQSPVSEAAVIMTTWHAEESLEDALAFALTGAWPSEDYAESCRAVVAVCVGNPTWAHTVREAFRDSAAFVAAWSAASE